jgi:hypothetical protein
MDGGRLGCHAPLVRRAGAVVAGVAAVLLVLAMVLVAYGLTSEYGPDPNGGGVSEAVVGVMLQVPLAVLVGLLVVVAAAGVTARRRVMLGVVAAVVTLLAVAGAVVAGTVALDRRCEAQGQQHSAACPGYDGA